MRPDPVQKLILMLLALLCLLTGGVLVSNLGSSCTTDGSGASTCHSWIAP